jgi:hypothetical protein
MIYKQLWIDGLRQPNDIWTLFRRTGGNLPKETDNAAYWQSTYGMYHRYTYPTSEQDYNFESWKTETVVLILTVQKPGWRNNSTGFLIKSGCPKGRPLFIL